MADTRPTVIEAVVVEENLRFTLAELCRACGAESSLLTALVEEGLLQPSGSGPEDWQFAAGALSRARAALRLMRDLQLSVDALALVVELLDEIETLRAQLRRAGSN
jgi:chaperone modulatory protein CbpM